MKFKKITALALAAVLTLSVAGCGSKDVTWVAQLGETKVAAGVYVLNVMNAISDASIKSGVAAEPGMDELFKADIEGKTGSQYIVDYAKEETLNQLAASSKFTEMGLTLTDEEKAQYEDYAKQMYASDAEMFTANGISEQSLIDFNRYSFESYKLFQTMYGPGGEKAASAEEISKYFSDTYYLAYAIPYLKVDAMTGAPLEGEALTKATADADAAFKAVQEGKNIADVAYEVVLSQIPEGSEKPERGADSDSVMVIDKLDINGYFPVVLTEYLATAEVGKVSLIEDETYKILVQRVDETTADPALAEAYYTQMVPQLKFEEYRDYCVQLGQGMGITWNDAAVAHYTGEKVKKDTDAYIKKMEAAQSSSLAVPPAPESSTASESSTVPESSTASESASASSSSDSASK